MGKDGSVAPKERVNIVYKPATGGAAEEVELPLKILMMGDYTQRPDARTVEDRATVQIDKDTFDAVLAKQRLALDLVVPDALTSEPGAERAVALRIEKLADFGPEEIASQVPELKKLLELRDALKTMRHPLANERDFRKKLDALLQSPEGRERALRELGLTRRSGS